MDDSLADVLDRADVLVEVFAALVAHLASSPLVALVVLLPVAAVARAAGGGRPIRDPRRCFSRAERIEILARAGDRCEQHSWLDGRCRETDRLHADHVHPHSRGGATDVANGQALCRRHNKRKSDRVPRNGELDRLARRRQTYSPTGTPTAVARYGAPAGQAVET